MTLTDIAQLDANDLPELIVATDETYVWPLPVVDVTAEPSDTPTPSATVSATLTATATHTLLPGVTPTETPTPTPTPTRITVVPQVNYYVYLPVIKHNLP